jgi:hypothetical protein
VARKPTGRPNGRPRKTRWIKDYAEIGELPADPLEAMEWGFKALMISLKKTLEDPEIPELRRSHEIRQHLRAARDQLPKARLAELARRLDDFEKKRAGGGATATAEAKVVDAAPEDARGSIRGSYSALRARRA